MDHLNSIDSHLPVQRSFHCRSLDILILRCAEIGCFDMFRLQLDVRASALLWNRTGPLAGHGSPRPPLELASYMKGVAKGMSKRPGNQRFSWLSQAADMKPQSNHFKIFQDISRYISYTGCACCKLKISKASRFAEKINSPPPKPRRKMWPEALLEAPHARNQADMHITHHITVSTYHHSYSSWLDIWSLLGSFWPSSPAAEIQALRFIQSSPGRSKTATVAAKKAKPCGHTFPMSSKGFCHPSHNLRCRNEEILCKGHQWNSLKMWGMYRNVGVNFSRSKSAKPFFFNQESNCEDSDLWIPKSIIMHRCIII